MVQTRRSAPVLLLGAALLAAAIVLTVAEWHVTYFQDTWSFLLERQPFDAESFLYPHNEHIVILPVAITKALLAIFGMSSNTPEQLAMGLTVLAVAALFFVYVRRRVGPWLALIGTVMLLFLGSGWWTMLWPFENEFTLPILFGLGALLVLERRDRRGDVLACVLISLSVISGSLGMCFVAAAFVDLLLNARQRGWRRAYVFAIPLFLYLVWYAGWGHKAEHHLTGKNILSAPAYVVEGFASSLNSLTGMSGVPHAAASAATWGPALLIGAIALIVIGQRLRPGFSKGFWVVTTAGVAYWLLAALNYIPGREPSQLRYVYAGAVFTLLIAAELLRNWRFGGRALIVAAVVAALTIGPNLAQMKEGSDYLQEQSVITRADLAALEISRETVDPSFALAPELAGTPSLTPVQAAPYFEAVDRWGSPAYDLAELEAAPEGGRHWADVVLSQALPIGHETGPGFSPRIPAGKECAVIEPGAAASKQIKLSRGVATTVEVAPGGPASISLRRFAQEEFPVQLGSVEGGTTTTLQVPRDLAPTPWYVHLEVAQLARVCR